MVVQDADVMAAAASVLSDGSDPVRDHVVAEMVVALFKANGEITPDMGEQPLDAIVEQVRRYMAFVDTQ